MAANKNIIGWAFAILIVVVLIALVVKNWDLITGKGNGGGGNGGGGNGGNGGNGGGGNGGGGNPPSEPPVVLPTSNIGKRVYAKSEKVHVRSSAKVNNGWINNILCELEPYHEPAPVVVDIIRSASDNYNWYKVQFDSDKELNTEGCYHLQYGWVREDVVNLK